ncbi:MAG: hypothetical protein ACRCW3_03570 [Metamycoplasmataceae bacterium]
MKLSINLDDNKEIFMEDKKCCNGSCKTEGKSCSVKSGATTTCPACGKSCC